MSILYKSRILDSSPVAYLRFGETSGLTAVDEIGSANGIYSSNGIIGGEPLVTNETDGSANFNGSTYIHLGSSIRDLFNGKQVITVEFLIKPNSLTGPRMILSLPGYGNNVAPFICSDPASRDEASCLLPGSCSNTNYADKNSCETATETWTAAECSDPGHTDQSSCEAAGTCSDPAQLDESACDTAGGTWTPETWTEGSCSDPAFADQTSCEGAVHEWTHDNTWTEWPGWLGHQAIFQVYTDGTKISAAAATSLYDGWFTESSSNALSSGTISHVIVEVDYSTGRIEILVNNSLVASATGSPESSTVVFDNGDIAGGFEDAIASIPKMTDVSFNISASIDDMSFYDRVLTTQEKSEHYTEALSDIEPVELSFQLSWQSTPATKAWMPLFTVDLYTEYDEVSEYTSLLYNIETLNEEGNVFKFKYKDTEADSIYAFRLRYRENYIPVERRYSQHLRYISDHIDDISNSFSFRYSTQIKQEGLPPYTFRFRYTLDIINDGDYTFNFKYFYKKSDIVTNVFGFPYHIRTIGAQATGSENYEIIDNGDGTYDYKFRLESRRITIGDYEAVIDSGSSYSAFFVPFIINYPTELPQTVILYDQYGLTITIEWEGLDFQNIEFHLRDVDIDSSLSITAYRIHEDEHLPMFELIPKWQSYIYVDENSESELVQLDSEEFKILPIQPETCCILKTREICELPARKGFSDLLPEEPSIEIPVDTIQVGEMLLMIEEPRSSYVYDDTYQAVITSTRVDATWDDIAAIGTGDPETEINPFVDMNIAVPGLTESVFVGNQSFPLSDYPIRPLSEIAAIAAFEEGISNWNEGSITVDFEFNPAIRPRSSEIEKYEDHIFMDGEWVGQQETLAIKPGTSLYIIRSIKIPNNRMMVLVAYNTSDIYFYIIDEDANLLREELIIGNDLLLHSKVAGTVLGNGNIMIVYETDNIALFKIYDNDGNLVIDETEVATDSYEFGITTSHDGNAVVLIYTYDSGTSDRTITIHTFDQNGIPLNTLSTTGVEALINSIPVMIENGDNKIVILYEGNNSWGYQITYNTLTNTWVSATPYRFTTYNFSNPRGVMKENGEIVVVHYRGNYGDAYLARFTNNGTFVNFYSVSSNSHPNPDIIATTEGMYKGGYAIIHNYSSTGYIRQYDSENTYKKRYYMQNNSNYSQHMTMVSIDGDGNMMAAYNNYYDRTENYFRKLEQDYISIVDRDIRRSSDAIIDRKQGFSLSMIDGFIFSTQLVRIERDISYIEGDPTLTGDISPMEHVFVGASEFLPNQNELGVGTNNDPIDISSDIISTGSVKPSTIDTDMIEYIEFITPPVIPDGGYALADTDHYGEIYRSQETGNAYYAFNLLDPLHQNPNDISNQEKINCMMRVRNTDMLIAATSGAGYEYSGIYISEDGGTNWRHSGLPLFNSWNSLSRPAFAAFNSNRGEYMYNDGDSQESYITADLSSNPKRWTRLPRHTNDNNISRGFTYNSASDTWYKASYKAVYASQDSGQSWIEVVKDSVGIPGYRFDAFSGIEIDSQNNVWIAGIMQDDATTTYSVVIVKLIPSDPLTPIVTWSYEYTNSGESYRDYGLIIDASDNIHFYNKNESTSKYVVLKSTDGGVTFIENDLIFLYDESTYPFGMDVGIPYQYTYINNLFYIIEYGSNYNRVFKSVDGISWDFVINSRNSDDDVKISCIHPIIT